MLYTDLSNCDSEQIHIPVKIQNHGFLIALDDNLTITHCTRNIEYFLKVVAEKLLGKSVTVLEELLESSNSDPFISQLIKTGMTIKGFAPLNPYPVYVQKQYFNLIISRSGGFYVLEFEPEMSDIKKNFQQFIGSSISEMLADANLEQLLTNTAAEIKKIIGYDRVMIYKFHNDGHGEVIAEEKNPELSPFLGLHYPASDIPKQARDLYKINLTRLISNVHVEPTDILSLMDSKLYPLDLTHVGLRAVSPIHIQYLKNMGVDSSFSISIVDKGELWGLVACHNYTPRYINYREREMSKLIGQVLSSALGFRKNKQDEAKKYLFKLNVDELVRKLVREDSLIEALCGHQVNLLDAVDAGGAVLFYDRSIHKIGKVPPESFLINLHQWLQKNTDQVVFHTDNLSEVFEQAAEVKETCSGILSCRINRELEEYMIWFRPEVISTIQWAGNPDKPAFADPSGKLQISPRKSFEIWSQNVRLTSRPWTTEDIESANHLREEVSFTINKKASELRVLNEKLKAAYDELDTFSYTISHDLKNPLSSIKGFTELLLLEENTSPEDLKFMLTRVLANATKMELMIKEVLDYSKATAQSITRKTVNMRELLEEIKQELIVGTKNADLEITIGQTPSLNGDQIMLTQIFSNVIGNAVKYSLKLQKPVVFINGKKIDEGVQYVITDNGIGVNAGELDRIFELFSRSEQAAEFEGSGVGLAIVKKLVNKHEGRVWVESEEGKGSSFYILFKN
ncbi:MAG TPA: ATP-binding protein [Puia sp.]|nr:ATP-binding protein [Puia sp.]